MLIKYSDKYVKIYFNMKITFLLLPLVVTPPPWVVKYQLLDPYIFCDLFNIICQFFSQSVVIIC